MSLFHVLLSNATGASAEIGLRRFNAFPTSPESAGDLHPLDKVVFNNRALTAPLLAIVSTHTHSSHSFQSIEQFYPFRPYPFHPISAGIDMIRLSRELTRSSRSAIAIRNSRNYVVASQTARAKEAAVCRSLSAIPAR